MVCTCNAVLFWFVASVICDCASIYKVSMLVLGIFFFILGELRLEVLYPLVPSKLHNKLKLMGQLVPWKLNNMWFRISKAHKSLWQLLVRHDHVN